MKKKITFQLKKKYETKIEEKKLSIDIIMGTSRYSTRFGSLSYHPQDCFVLDVIPAQLLSLYLGNLYTALSRRTFSRDKKSASMLIRC